MLDLTLLTASTKAAAGRTQASYCLLFRMLQQAPYDLIADKWSQARSLAGSREKSYVDRLLELLESGAHVLDLGCGSGSPIARYLVDSGYQVTGVDSSS